MTSEAPILLSADEAAAVLGIPVATLVSWAVRGKVEKHRTPDGRALYDMTTLDRRDHRLGAVPRKPGEGLVCVVVEVAAVVTSTPAVLWPGNVAQPPLVDGAWAEWVIERDALPAHACTPNLPRIGWTMAGYGG